MCPLQKQTFRTFIQDQLYGMK
uniref:Uncharacterized protein n=1 Tax=Megaselia scalaris TaxID=36166 RepID=T1GXZ3_MEGSC